MRPAARALVLLCCALVYAIPAAGTDLEGSRRARALADELMSPFCPGRTLSDCPSPNASAVREEIRTWVGEGRTDAEIRDRLRARFGDGLAGEPQSAWGRILPFAAIALVGLLFVLGLRRVVSRQADDAP